MPKLELAGATYEVDEHGFMQETRALERGCRRRLRGPAKASTS